jgi:prepilin peptidase CpaA
MDTSRIIGLCTLVILLSVSVYTELIARRIPNWLTFFGVGVGLLLGCLPGGISLQSSVLGFAVGFGFLLIFYLYGGMGGGDVKLMGAVGSLLGYPLIKPAILFTAIIGVILAVFYLLFQRAFWMRASLMIRRVAGFTPANTELPPVQRSVPYGIAIAGGTLLLLLLAGVAP